MYTLFITGTAGSGKSTLTGSLNEWLRDQEQSTITVNLDPAVTVLPYEPDVDVRDVVDYERIMVTRRLGPNAALIASIREVARHIEGLREEVNSFNVDYALVDTPGQLELFAFRKEGKIIARNLTDGSKAMLFLLDPMFCVNPKNFAASIFLSVSIYLSFGIPLLMALSKVDAVPKRYVSRILRWAESDEAFLVDLETKLKGAQMLLARDVAKAVFDVSAFIPIIPVSALNMSGLVELHSALTRIFSEGELELR
ncbi:MAG: ATP/GTP-binding protein [Nitrososphaerota archaeon]